MVLGHGWALGNEESEEFIENRPYDMNMIEVWMRDVSLKNRT